VLQEVAKGSGHERAEGPSAIAVSEFGELWGQICGEPAARCQTD